MQRNILVSAVIIFWLTNSSLGDKLSEALQDKYTAECVRLADCEGVLSYGEAFECSEGKCKCHPDGALDEVNKQCRCNAGFEKLGNKCLKVFTTRPSTHLNATTRTSTFRSTPRPSQPVQPGVPDEPVEGSGRAGAPGVPVSGPTCSRDSDCGEHQVCDSRICRCDANYTSVNGICRRAAQFVGDYCEYKEQCTYSLGGRSSCENSRCVCDPGNIPANNRTVCMLLKGLMETCVHPEQCQTNYSSCITSVCLCKEHYVNDDNRVCLPILHTYGAICSISTQCHNGNLGLGSQCAKTGADEGKCICLNSYHYNEKKRKCLSTVGIDEECDENRGCYLPLDGDNQGIECKNSKCRCKKHHVLSEDKQHCSSASFTQHSSLLVIVLTAILSRKW